MKIKTVKKAPAAKAVVKKAATCAAKCCCATQKPATKAVTFTVHAEKGKAVYVAGEFNDWDQEANFLEPMENGGVWRGFIAGVGVEGYALAIQSLLK